MKIILMLALLTVTTLANAKVELNPLVAVGHRFGNSELNGDSAFYVSAKMTTFVFEVETFKYINLLSPGINFQDDGKWALSVSPISISSMSGLTFGLDYIPKTKNVKGSEYGLFVALKFQ